MKEVYETDKSIQVNGSTLSKYGNDSEVWNLVMPSGGWDNRPTRILLNDSIDLIHKDNVYITDAGANINIYANHNGLTWREDCGEDQVIFDWEFALYLDSRAYSQLTWAGDFTISRNNNDLYTDQDLTLSVTVSGSGGSQTVTLATISKGWHAYDVSVTGRFESRWIYGINSVKFTIKSASDNQPVRFQYNYKDKYGKGWSGTTTTSWVTLPNIRNGISFEGRSEGGKGTFGTADVLIERSERVY